MRRLGVATNQSPRRGNFQPENLRDHINFDSQSDAL
jgi:hypothetical protein